ncbi:MAG: 50S ribosome-binding GTPase, partial [Acidimicrobiia bacterium]|nr:50S ribosome-binding GTPase [Acidimicrobiia bacterium]
GPDDLAAARAVADDVGSRLGYLGETVVVALAGGTGSGKSSLLNALAGSEVTEVGAVRPTTADPTAWIPANPEPGLVRLLDELGIDRRIGHNGPASLALVDLPDYDSVEFEHRATVERLVPRVDAIVWVLDPQKYSDRALHRDYLVPLADYEDQFLFALNQVDRLDDSGMEAVLTDLEARLRAEGYQQPVIVTTAARPADGGPPRVEALSEVLAHRLDAKRTVRAKLATDLSRARDRLATAAGLTDRAGPTPAERWEATEHDAIEGLTGLLVDSAAIEQASRVGERTAMSRAAGPIGRLGALLRRSRFGRALGAAPDEPGPGHWWTRPGLERVLSEVSRAVTDTSVQLGGPLGRRLREDFGPDQLEEQLRASVEGTHHNVGDIQGVSARWWWGLVGVVQLALFAALVSGLVWLYVDGVDRGEFPWNLVLVGGSIIVATVLSWAVGASGRRLGRRAGERYRQRVETAMAAQVRTRLSDPILDSIRRRDELAEALAKMSQALAGS